MKKSPKIPYTGVVTSFFCNFHMMSTKCFVSNRLIGAYIGVIFTPANPGTVVTAGNIHIGNANFQLPSTAQQNPQPEVIIKLNGNAYYMEPDSVTFVSTVGMVVWFLRFHHCHKLIR